MTAANSDELADKVEEEFEDEFDPMSIWKLCDCKCWQKVIGKGRPRFTKQGRTYTPKKTLDYEREIKIAYASKYTYLSKRSLSNGNCALTISRLLKLAFEYQKAKKKC